MAIHPFEAAGLGKAPFKFVGHQELVFIAYPGATPRAGGSCDYCFTGIRDAYFVKSADGKTFKVGCDCIRKVYKDYGSRDPLVIAVNKARAASAKASKETRVRFAREAFEADPSLLADKPHPQEWAAKKGLTLRDYTAWMFEHAGLAGSLKVARFIEAALKE